MSKLANQIKQGGAVIRRRQTEDHPSAFLTVKEGRLFRLALDQIFPNPDQPRKFFDQEKLAELASSIRDQGVLQPILVREERLADDDSRYIIVAGERRFRAAGLAGLIEIPALITMGDPDEIAIIENLQRENLKPVEEAEGLAKLMASHGYTQEKLGEVVGKAKSTVSEILSLTKLPQAIRDEVRSSELSKMVLIEIAKQDSEEMMLSLFDQIKQGGLKGYAVRKITRQTKERAHHSKGELFLGKLQELKKTLRKMDRQDISEEEKTTFWQEFDDLHHLLTKLTK
ncbi:MAG: ParB/RepB/Spo0J family partition protein [Proteobacteria bacterium]|nr:ParB/RepB/Spo0J family partition protein [Desulfobulbaceae bacterium]MBU4152951.1 ParB/RepB/Spo0J family partition protein [Pseudomonadota bacterium]